MPSASALTSPSPSPSPSISISARELHEVLLMTHTSENVAKRRFIDALRSLAEARLFLELGFQTIAAYADATFRIGKSLTYEYLRVSESLASLPEIGRAFERAEISYTLMAELSRVATSETEAEWLALARAQSVGATIAEAREAWRRNRQRPRKGSYGLPALAVKLRFELTPEDHAVVEQGFAKLGEEMAAGLDGARPEPEKVLLYIMDRVLHERPSAAVAAPSAPDAPTPASTKSREEPSPYTVAFVRCPDCHRAAVETSVGRVEITPDALSKFSGSAERVEIEPERELPPEDILVASTATAEADSSTSPDSSEVVPEAERDPPNSGKLRRELRARAGGRCENPHCRAQTRGGGHGHHMVGRAVGGATALWNEVHVCERCHGLIHAGSLQITGSRLRGLCWTPRAADITRRVREELARAHGLPVVRFVRDARESAGIGDAQSGHPESDPTVDAQSGHPELEDTTDRTVADATGALRSLGFTQREASDRAHRAWQRLRDGEGRPTRHDALLPELIRDALGG